MNSDDSPKESNHSYHDYENAGSTRPTPSGAAKIAREFFTTRLYVAVILVPPVVKV